MLTPVISVQQLLVILPLKQFIKYDFYAIFSGTNYANIGLDLKRHVEEQNDGSPSSSGENADSIQEPEVKRPRQEYDTE